MSAPFWPYVPTQLPLVAVSVLMNVAAAGGGPALKTVTETAAEVVLWFKLSVAMAFKECPVLPAVVVSQEIEYGALLTVVPRFTPSSWNCTETGIAEEETVAVTVVEPAMVAPAVGVVIETVGAGGPALAEVTVTPGDVPCWPTESVAMAVSTCEPFPAVVLFHEIEYGAALTTPPRFTPSSWNWTEE